MCSVQLKPCRYDYNSELFESVHAEPLDTRAHGLQYSGHCYEEGALSPEDDHKDKDENERSKQVLSVAQLRAGLPLRLGYTQE
jgi:hypothetical protein